jgi:iron(III) transport system ATP-binding protein
MIELNGVRKSYGNVVAVNRVSLDIPDHARIAITGPSGSGKTTLLRLIAGLEIPNEGTITMDGKLANDPDPVIPPSGRGIGFVFQTAALWPHMTVRQNILFGLQGMPVETAENRITALLERMGIAHLKERYPDQISGGEARRVALARALAIRPSLLLFDEPLTSLDDEIREDLLNLITATVRESGASMVFVTHNPVEAEAVADTILRFRQGAFVPS